MNALIFMLALQQILCLLTATKADFDLKSALLAHRSQYTNHLEKDVAFEHFRRLDKERIRKLTELIATHERQMGSIEGDEDPDSKAHRHLVRSKAVLSKLLSETANDKQDRYAELHESMVANHDQGLSDLDFTLTGL